ncbi:MAG: pyridoxamine kinase [Clostridium sp.]
MNTLKKIAMINDISGYGRCALTAAIPVISALKVQCCPVLTAILSNHAGYSSCFFDDYTDQMIPYIDEWKKHDFKFDGIMTGFMASYEQVKIVTDFIHHFKSDKTQLLVDPVMGDHGVPYRVCSAQLCDGFRELIPYADVITPNLTEGCLLTDTPYKETGWSKRKLTDLTYKLLLMGAGAVVLTGVVKGNLIINVIHERGKEPIFQTAHYVDAPHHGTGDVFSAVIGASLVKGVPLEEAVRRAAAFTRKCVERSEELKIPEKEGLCLEECLPYLMKQA